MKCESFAAWLENRDMHDVSEADKAYRHAEECAPCCDMLKKDEMLDRLIVDSLCCEPIPASLKNSVDLSIERSDPRTSRKGLIAAVSAMCLAVVIIFGFTTGENTGFSSMDEFGDFLQADYRDHGQASAIFDPVNDPALWFAANAEGVALPPEQLVGGYTVKGARFCHLGHCKAVHMLYEKGGVLVSVFVVEENEIDFRLEEGRVYSFNIDGDSIKLYKSNDQVYALVT
ncbi:hypothetical protein [Desulfosediminicola flagellatus]|uniref:hypothetical protein n=1 Tax=Desulfosediminicola flagellatus TaxID=2569541 RepID=UPI0010ABB11D|nr:hypothetical protein [Desulfosediminicola flagellatus]